MSLSTITVYTDDTDAFVDRVITDAAGNDLTWTANVAVDDGAFDVTGSWQGDVGPSRTLRVPLVGLTVGAHRLYLSVPGANDLPLGTVYVTDRR